MSLENRKITTYQDNIKSLPDYPSDNGISAAELKAMFDGRTDKEVKEKFNGLIDDLIALFAEIKNQTKTEIENHNESETAHEELFDEVEQFIISAVSDKVTEEEIETRLTPIEETLAEKADEEALLTKVDKVFGKGLSTNDFTNADKAALDEAKDATERVNAHLADFNNPHNVMPGQIGALTEEEAMKKFVDKDTYGVDIQYFDYLIFNTIDKVEEVEGNIGNIDTALDAILAIQNELIGGVA